MLILGIETSCDETSLALLEEKKGSLVVKENIVSSQIKIHSEYGGVVPEVAARKHVETIFSILGEFTSNDLRKKIDVISVASGPGLITSLLVGAEVARTISYVWRKPLVSVNHVISHIYANWLAPISNLKSQISNLKSIEFPVLCLVVSGGHTELVLMNGHRKFRVIGRTLDDAAGECFDKCAKILGLGYPGGPAIAQEAEKFVIARSDRRERRGNLLVSRIGGGCFAPLRSARNDMCLPRPMINTPDFNFSFSGLKTAVLYKVRDLAETRGGLPIEFRSWLAFEIQEAITEVSVSKTIKAAKKYKVKTIMLAGGVAANKRLRERLGAAVRVEMPDVRYQMPDIKYCTDNAAMVAAAGYFYAKNKKFTPWEKLKVDPNWEL
jgi:N6-L-threonylcarbamoyladenine synthase